MSEVRNRAKYSRNTFTFKTLFHQTEQHLATEITEMRWLVWVDMKDVRTNLQLFHRSARYWHTHTHTWMHSIISLHLHAHA